MGNPLNSLLWLANKLRERGSYIKKGDIILSGSFTAAIDIDPFDKLTAKFENVGSVDLYIE